MNSNYFKNYQFSFGSLSYSLCPGLLATRYKVSSKLSQQVFIERLQSKAGNCWVRKLCFYRLCSAWGNWLAYHLQAVLLNFFPSNPSWERKFCEALCFAPCISVSLLRWVVCHHLNIAAPSFCHVLCIAGKPETTFHTEAVAGRCGPDADRSVAAASRSLAGHLPRC